jgi:hypothetical protein
MTVGRSVQLSASDMRMCLGDSPAYHFVHLVEQDLEIEETIRRMRFTVFLELPDGYNNVAAYSESHRGWFLKYRPT